MPKYGTFEFVNVSMLYSRITAEKKKKNDFVNKQKVTICR